MAPTQQSQYPERLDNSAALRRLTWRGAIIVGTFGISFGVWAARVPIDGAVVASGQFVVDSSVRKVQHPTGGVVGELNVAEGSLVQKGDVVLRLDQTVLRAGLEGIQKKIDELESKIARLEAERLGYDTPPAFPADLQKRISDERVAKILATEIALYEARKSSHLLRKKRLGERVQQLQAESDSIKSDLIAKKKLADITTEELVSLRSLKERNLVSLQRINSIERDAVNVEGQKAQLEASVAQVDGKILETELQSLSLDDELRAETTKELREAQAALAQESEKLVAAMDQLARVEVRAPITGVVHQLSVHTVGGVVRAADPMMLIVPRDEALELEVKVKPQDIDQLQMGQAASIRIHAFNQRTTPVIQGKVSRISADVTADERTSETYYTARVAIGPSEHDKLNGLTLQAGMQAEALIRTSERTMFEYLTKPLVEQMRRSMRER